MSMILGLISIAILPVIVAALLYLIDNKTAFGMLGYKQKQITAGVIFGCLAILGTEFGVDVHGATANARDASVLTAGLIFGSPAGVIAGLIGGIERFFAVYWGAGEYTRIACTFSTIISGILGAVLRKYMFDNKKPTTLYAFAIGLVAEVMHMLMVFITNLDDIETAFVVISNVAPAMIIVNSVAVMLAVLFVRLLGKNIQFIKKKYMQLASVAQKWLLICVSVSFVVTCAFTAFLQFRISDNSTDEILRINVEDVVIDILDASDRNLLDKTKMAAKDYENGLDVFEIAEKYGVADVCIINKYGFISESTNPDFIAYSMSKGEQSAEFLKLLLGEEELVQSYQPISYNSDISRKYAGVILEEEGFIQLGLDAKGFQQDLASEVANAAHNRHIGQNGYVIIVDEDFNVVSSRREKTDESEFKQITIDEDTRPGERFSANFFDEDVYGMYLESEGYYIFGLIPKEEADFSRDLSIYMMVFMEVIIFIGLFILTYFLIKTLVLDNLMSVNNSLHEITGGNLNVTVNVRSNEEFASLSDDINATVDTLKRYIDEAAARIDAELELAKVIQASSLPSVDNPFPDKKEVDIFATMRPAKEVGGDFFDFYFLDDHRLAILVADVSGKGITAAMFMMKAKALIKGFAERENDPAKTLTLANNALCEGNQAEMFVTCFMAIIDYDKRIIECANAGHNPPLIRRKNGKFEYLKLRASFVLAGMEDINYRKTELEFNPGDTIFLYTDGVTEATDINNLLYGEKRLIDTLNNNKIEDSKSICELVNKDVDEFVDEAPQFDDITVLCVKVD